MTVDREALEVVQPAREARRRASALPGAKPLSWSIRLQMRVGAWLVVTLARTWRVRVYGRRWLLDRQPTDARVVVAFWHGTLLPICWVQRQPTCALVSQHRDGELIAHLLGVFGHSSVRGSSSRGGARALLECVTTLRSGMDVAITPDGPRGPRHRFAPGALLLAFRARTSVIPVGVYSDRVWRLASWDQHEIPKPFARVTVVYGAPLAVVGESARAVADDTTRFADALQAVNARAETLARQPSPKVP